jgi:hypothetical protein
LNNHFFKENLMSYAVLVLEHPWFRVSVDPAQTSIAPFLDGLSRLNGLSVFYATFFDARSFGQALEHLMDARKLDAVKRIIIYVASHGSGGRIGGEIGINLRTVFRRIAELGHDKVVGVILDACEVGMQVDIIEAGMNEAHIRWVTGFSASLDWLTATSIHLHLLSGLSGLTIGQLGKRANLVEAVQTAMDVFNPALLIPPVDDEDDDDLEVGEDEADEEDDEDEPLTLSQVMTVMIRPNNAPPELLGAEEIWPMLADD